MRYDLNMKKLTKLETAIVITSLIEQQGMIIKKMKLSKDKVQTDCLKNILKQLESALKKIGGA